MANVQGTFHATTSVPQLQIISAVSQRFDSLPELIETHRTAAPLYAPSVPNGPAPCPWARFGTAAGLQVPARIERAVVLVRTWRHNLNGCRRYGCACQLAGHPYAGCVRHFFQFSCRSLLEVSSSTFGSPVDLHPPGAKEACRVRPWNQESVGVEQFCVGEWQTFKGRFTPLPRSLNCKLFRPRRSDSIHYRS